MTADERIARLEKWLHELYGVAEKEMRGKWDAFMKDLRADGDKLLKAIDDAKDDTERRKAWRAYTAYMRDSTVTDKYFRQMVDELARQYAEAGVTAAEIVNGDRLGAFADGYNFSAGEINRVAASENVGIRFDMCDAGTIEHLAEHAEDLLLPPRQHPEELNLAVWNVHNINTQVTQGIVQGESIPKIAARLSNVTRMNEVAAVRTARTMTTAAENAGRVQSMQTAAGWGVKTRKRWMCTHDSRTRHSHLMLDGETVADDAKFSNKCRYPGDPNGPPEEVYNCRCTITTVLDGFSSNLPKGKEDAVHVSIDGHEVPRGQAYFPTWETKQEAVHREAVRRLIEEWDTPEARARRRKKKKKKNDGGVK